MPAYERAMPTGATNVVIRKGAYTYPVDIDTHGFTRTGIDGAEKILALFADENFQGEYLEPSWKKGWSGTFKSTAPFTAIVDTTNDLVEFQGLSNVQNAWIAGWNNSNKPIILMDDLELTVQLEAPANTASGANQQFFFQFLLIKDKTEARPDTTNDHFAVRMWIAPTGLLLELVTMIGGASTTIFGGSDYDANNARAATGRVTTWRLVFHEADVDKATRHVHVYLKQGADATLAEAATEYELIDSGGTESSPFDISGLLFQTAYPAYVINTEDDTDYYASGNKAKSDYYRVSYPDFNVEYDLADAYQNKGEVKIFDTRGVTDETLWHRVMDKNYDFVGDCVIQNGLIRLYIEEGVSNGLQLYWWTGSTWEKITTDIKFYLNTDAVWLTYPYLSLINSLSTEKIIAKLRLQNSASNDSDTYMDVLITFKRGSYSLNMEVDSLYPIQAYRFSTQIITDHRFGYFGDDKIEDDDLGINTSNTTKTDNFMTSFDDLGKLILYTVSLDDDTPNWYGSGTAVMYIYSFDSMDRPNITLSVTSFPLIVNLFKEAESATKSAAVRLYMDGAGEDTVTEGQAVWAATANVVVDVNDATDPQVGAKSLKLDSVGAGTVSSRGTPAAPLGKLTKFDTLKLWAWSEAGPEVSSLGIRLIDADGDAVAKAFSITATPTQYTHNLPHSSSDLQGWSEAGTYDFTTLTIIEMFWTAGGANETVFIDGLHEYIGTTTARGRGETLSGGSAVVLDAQNEQAYLTLNPIETYLPMGKYLLIVRAKDTDQFADDFRFRIYNVTDSRILHESGGGYIYKTLTDSMAYYMESFELASWDEGDRIDINLQKYRVNENTIFTDYWLLIFLGDGESGPMDLAHNSLYKFTTTKDRYDPS